MLMFCCERVKRPRQQADYSTHKDIASIMGSSESKIAVASTPILVASTPKPDPSKRLRNERVDQLVDPRSPSTAIDRTPIQVGGAVSCPPVVVESESTSDPRSPSIGVTRTPMKDSMKVSVGSFARRLGMLFLTDTDAPVKEKEEVVVDGELGSSQPLLSQPSQADILPTPILSSPQSMGDDTLLMGSPFVHLAEVEADLTLEEAEEAKESPLHKRLSMSLITYHDGAPFQFFAEVHNDYPQSPLLNADSETHGDEPDHSYAQLSTPMMPASGGLKAEMPVSGDLEPEMPVSGDLEPEMPVSGSLEGEMPVSGDLEGEMPVSGDLEPEMPVSGDLEPEMPVSGDLEPEMPVSGDLQPEMPVSGSLEPEMPVSGSLEPEMPVSGDLEPEMPVSGDLEGEMPASGDLEGEMPTVQELPVAPPTTTTQALTGPSPGVSQQPQTGIRCPTFDTKSPSQVVFKPQWLGKGFGATGLKARGVQGRGGKASSPLSVRVGGKNVGNENKGQSAKQKQRGKALMAEGRSPLQILKATNSPRDQSTQMKLKVSTPDRQRLGQLDRRVLTVALNKENR